MKQSLKAPRTREFGQPAEPSSASGQREKAPPKRGGKAPQSKNPRSPAVTLAEVPDERADSRHFRALLEPDHTSLKWTVIRVPFHCATMWPHMVRRRVAGTVNGHPFRTTLFPAPGGAKGEVFIVNKKMQAAAHVRVGSHAEIVLWADLAERPVELPPELIAAFDGDRRLHRWTLTLSDSNRREIGKWIYGVQSVESRAGRSRQMAERLLSAMEAEHETPPILEILFRSNPRARSGWLALTPHQRRSHLLGIFYYRTPEARIRRAKKAVAEALRAAEKP